jgi:hypothetical protein
LWDRQYCTSIVIFAAATVVVISGIVWVLFRLGWLGVVGLVAMAGAWLAWFYWGPRPDLNPRGRDDELEAPESE